MVSVCKREDKKERFGNRKVPIIVVFRFKIMVQNISQKYLTPKISFL